MRNPFPPGSFENLLKRSTLNRIYEKFHAATFTTRDVVSALYWIGSVEKHVQYMHRRGWIVLENGTFRFVVEPAEWVFGGEVH